MIVTKGVFFDIQSKMDCISYDQSTGYHAFIGKNKIIYFTDDSSNPNVCVWGVVEKKFKGLSILKISGESLKKRLHTKTIKVFILKLLKNQLIIL